MTSAAPLGQTLNERSVCGLEEWRVVPGYPANEISNRGHVRKTVGGKGAVGGRILKSIRSSSGHLAVVLHQNGVRSKQQIHRLVAMAFIGPAPEPGLCVLHFDDNPTNNTPPNLRWGMSKENAADRKLNRGWHDLAGAKNPAARLNERTVAAIRVWLTLGICGSCLGRIFGVSKKTIYAIHKGRTCSKEDVRS
jgi:hypothetical protein